MQTPSPTAPSPALPSPFRLFPGFGWGSFGTWIAVIALLAVPLMLVALVLRGAEELKRRNLGLRDVAGVLFRQIGRASCRERV